MATELFLINIKATGTRKTSRDIKRIGTSAQTVRKTLAFMRSALVAVAAVRVFSRLSTDLAAFSDSMSAVRAITGATAVQFQQLRSVARDLGATTRFTAAEAADGMAFLARAGFDTAQVIGTIPATLDLASAGIIELGDAADIASNLMTSFNLSTIETVGVIDTLVFTANNANTSVQQLADGLKLVAPIASGLGVSLEQASSAMAVLGDNGIQASLAGTGLRRVITDLEAPTGTLLKVLNKLNIPLEDVRISSVGLVGALDRLREANIGASISSVLFGKRGGFVAAALLRDVDKIRAFEKAQKDNGGTARRVAKIMEENLAGAFRAVRSALQAVIIALGDLGAEKFLEDFFFGLATALRALARNADNAFAAMKVLIAVFVIRRVLLFGNAVLILSVNMGRLVKNTLLAPKAFLAATFSVRGFATALRTIPFILVVTTLGLIISGFAAFRDEIKLTRDGAVTMNDVFVATSKTIGTTFLTALNNLGGNFTSFREIVDTVIRRTGLGFVRLVANVNGVVETIKAIFGDLPTFFKNLGTEIERAFFRLLQRNLNDLLSRFNSVFKTFGIARRFELFDLSESIPDATKLGGTLKDAFNRGFEQVGIELFSASDVRRANDRIEQFNQFAAASRDSLAGLTAPIRTPLEGGITLEDVGLAPGEAAGGKDAIEGLTQALRDLESSVSPLLASQDALAETQRIINDATAKGIDLRITEAELLARVRREQLGANATVAQAAEEQQVLKKALDDTIISLEEFEFLSRKSAIAFLDSQRDAASGAKRAFLKLTQDATDAAAFTEMVFTDAFSAIGDAVADFVTTGTFSLNEFFRNFAAQLIKLGTQQAIAGIGGAAAGQFGFGGPSGGAIAGIGGLFTNLLGLKDGGSFKVGSNTAIQSLPGIDNRLVAFRAREGEEVTVTPKNTPGGSAVGPTNIVFNVQAQDADSFVRSQSQIQNRLLAGIGQARRRR